MSKPSDFFGGGGSLTNDHMVGAQIAFPPQIEHVSPDWLPKTGGTYNRDAYPALWQWLQLHPELICTEAEWQAYVTASPIAACEQYSSGDGASTFRVPTVGIGGFSQDVGTGALPSDVVGGFEDQIENITGEFGWLQLGGGNQGIKGAFKASTNKGYANNVYSRDPGNIGSYNGATLFDASLVARTGTETRPKGHYQKVFIYSGNVTTKLPTPSADWLAQQQTNTDAIAAIPRIIAQGSNGGINWRKWSDGLIEQFGFFLAGNSVSGTITFPVEFSNNKYSLLLTQGASTGGGATTIREELSDTRTVSSCQWRTVHGEGSVRTYSISFMAIGY